MAAEEDPRAAEPEPGAGRQARFTVDARHASGVVVGAGSTQINYHYGSGPTWNDGVAAPPLVSVSGRVDSPYRGLSAFEEQDAVFFFGRETAATQILRLMSRRLEGQGLLVVSGASGVGKSSLLRAGVLPRLRGAGLGSAPGSAMWPCLAFTPARGPLGELAARVAALAGADAAAVRRSLEADPAGFALTARQAALAAAEEGWAGFVPEPRLLLLIDQFEQLFTQCADEQQRRAFITALHAAATTGHGPRELPAALVVLAVRADFEARCADYPELADAVQDRYLVTPMSQRQLRMAIAEPALKAGSMVEADLVRVLLDEAGNRALVLTSAGAGASVVSRAGVLPLLSHALDQAWRQRTGDALTLADYERAGGIESAVAASAQRAYNGLTSTQQTAARRVFTRLAATGPDGMDLADRVSHAELMDGKSPEHAHDVAAVLERFAAERLLTLAAGTVEISHEALLTAWPLLRDEWLAETRADRIARTRLRSTAADWAHQSRDPSYLYRGSLLEAAAASAARITADPARHPPLSAGERDFLDASSAWQGREQRKARRRVRYRLATLVAVLVVIATSVVFSARQVQLTSQRDQMLAQSLLVAAEADRLRSRDVPLSMQLALAAYRAAPTPEARSSLLDSTDVPAATRLPDAGGSAENVAVSDSGNLIAVGSDVGAVQLWRAAAGGMVRRVGKPLHGPASPVTSLAFGPDGAILAAAAEGDSRLWLWDTADPAHPVSMGKISAHGGAILSVAISPDGRTMAAASTDDKVYLCDISDRAHPVLLARLTGPAGPVTSVAFTPGGHILAAGSQDTRVHIWNVTHPARPAPLAPLTGPASQIFSIAISPNGRYLAAGTGAQHDVYLWDIRDPARPARAGQPLKGPSSWINSVAFSPDGQTLAAGSADGQAWLFNLTGREPVGQLPHPNPVTDVVYRNDASLMTVSSDGTNGTVRVWQLPGPVITASKDNVFAVSFDGTGHKLGIGPNSQDNTLTVWNPADIQHPIMLGPRLVNSGASKYSGSGALTPDGHTFAVGCLDGSVQLWNISDPTNPTLYGPPIKAAMGLVESVTISGSGRLLAVSSDDGAVHLWDITNPRQPVPLAELHPRPSGLIYASAFNRNSHLLAVASSNDKVYLWDISDPGRPRLVSTLTGFTEAAYSAAFTNNDKVLAAGGADSTVRLWDITRPADPVPLATLHGPTATVYSVAYDPSRHLLAAGSTDSTIWLWNLASPGQPDHLATLTGPAKGILAVAFSPDGHTLAAGSEDDTVHLWNTDPTMVATWICATAGQAITKKEWAQFIPGLHYTPPCKMQ